MINQDSLPVVVDDTAIASGFEISPNSAVVPIAQESDNTMLYVGVALAVLALVFLFD